MYLGTSTFLPLFFLTFTYANQPATFNNEELPVKSSNVFELDDVNWHLVLNGEWMVEFFAPWCPACKALQPPWREFAEEAKNININVAQVDITQYPGLSGRFMVTALPTIYHVKDGVFRQYKGVRNKDAFVKFITQNEWQEIEPLSSWKSPASFQMSVISLFFKLSQLLRTIHNTLLSEYGLPVWGSYAVFAIVTIFIGALIGLGIVCIIDFIFPPKITVNKSLEGEDDKKESEEDTDDDIAAQEELVDEHATNSDDASLVRKRKARKAD